MITHGYAKDCRDAALKSIEANVDMDMQSGLYMEYLPELVDDEEREKPGNTEQRESNQGP